MEISATFWLFEAIEAQLLPLVMAALYL